MNRHYWVCRLQDALRRGESVVLQQATLLGNKTLVAVFTDGEMYFAPLLHTKSKHIRDDAARAIRVTDPEAIARCIRTTPTRTKHVTVEVEGRVIEADWYRMDKTAPFLIKMLLAHYARYPERRGENVRITTDLGREVTLNVPEPPGDDDQCIIFGNLPPVRPGERFLVNGIVHRLEPAHATFSRELVRMLKMGLKNLTNEAITFRTLLHRKADEYLEDTPFALESLAEMAMAAGGVEVTIPFGLNYTSLNPADLMVFLCAIVTDTQVSQRKLELLNLIPGEPSPRWYPVPVGPDSTVRRYFWQTYSITDAGMVRFSIYYRRGLCTQLTPLHAARLHVDYQRGMVQLYQNDKPVGDEFPVARRLPLRPRGLFRYPVVGIGINPNQVLSSQLLSVEWRSYDELIEAFRLYKHLRQLGYSEPLQPTLSEALLSNLLYNALPTRLSIAELAGAYYYLTRGRYVELLENSVPGWKSSYAAAMDVVTRSPIDDVSEAIECVLNL